MPRFKFEAMDARGEEIRDIIDAPTEEEAQSTIRQMGYFVTMIRQEDLEKNPKPYRSIRVGRPHVKITKIDLLIITLIILSIVEIIVTLIR